MQSYRNNPDGEENQTATKQNRREVFASKNQQPTKTMTMNPNQKSIYVWPDDASGGVENRKWIVSLGQHGGDHTVSINATREEATRLAFVLSEQLDCPVYVQQ